MQTNGDVRGLLDTDTVVGGYSYPHPPSGTVVASAAVDVAVAAPRKPRPPPPIRPVNISAAVLRRFCLYLAGGPPPLVFRRPLNLGHERLFPLLPPPCTPKIIHPPNREYSLELSSPSTSPPADFIGRHLSNRPLPPPPHEYNR